MKTESPFIYEQRKREQIERQRRANDRIVWFTLGASIGLVIGFGLMTLSL